MNMPTFFPSPPSVPPAAVAPTVAAPEAATPPVTTPPLVPGADAPPHDGRPSLVLSMGDIRVPVTRDVFLGRAPIVPDGVDADVLAIAGEGTVSKTHAVLRMSDEGPSLEDLGSTNGTAEVVDGEPRLLAPRTPLALRAPAVIRLGDAVLELSLDSD